MGTVSVQYALSIRAQRWCGRAGMSLHGAQGGKRESERIYCHYQLVDAAIVVPSLDGVRVVRKNKE